MTTTAVANSGVAGSPFAITPAVGTLTAANYDFTVFTPGNLTITKAHLTVTADNQTRAYGAANPTLTATISGFVNGETLGTSGVTGTASVTTTSVANSGVAGSPYAITPIVGTLTAANYDFTIFTPGNLTITKAHLTVIADDQARPLWSHQPDADGDCQRVRERRDTRHERSDRNGERDHNIRGQQRRGRESVRDYTSRGNADGGQLRFHHFHAGQFDDHQSALDGDR